MEIALRLPIGLQRSPDAGRAPSTGATFFCALGEDRMLRRKKQKRVVDMTNEEAAAFYVRRAVMAENGGNYGRANHLFHTAALHDPTNVDASAGIERTGPICEQQQKAATAAPAPATYTHQHSPGRRRRTRRPWWKRALSSVKLGS